MTTIDGQEHQVTESARHQGAINMKLSLAKRIEVERWFVDKFGEEEGMRRCRHQFPEAYED